MRPTCNPGIRDGETDEERVGGQLRHHETVSKVKADLAASNLIRDSQLAAL